MTQSKPLRYTNGILSFLFIVFAAFQVNDVDPEIYHNPSKLDAGLWLVFYALIGVMLIVVLFRKIPNWLIAVSVIACIAQMAISGPGLYQNLYGGEEFTMTQESMSAEDPRVELTREFFGAVIALLGVVWIWVQHRYVGVFPKPNTETLVE